MSLYIFIVFFIAYALRVVEKYRLESRCLIILKSVFLIFTCPMQYYEKILILKSRISQNSIYQLHIIWVWHTFRDFWHTCARICGNKKTCLTPLVTCRLFIFLHSMMSTFQIYFWEFSTILKISMLCLILAHVRQKRNMMCAKTCAIILILLIIHFYGIINQGFMLLVKKETITNAIVCHENNLKQLEFWIFGKHVFFILCVFVCFRKCYFLIKYEAISFL